MRAQGTAGCWYGSAAGERPGGPLHPAARARVREITARIRPSDAAYGMMHGRAALGGLVMTSALALGAAACAPSASPARSPDDVSLVAGDGRRLGTAELVRGADWSVLVFMSRQCPCLAAHDERLRELATTFASRGVRFAAID